MGIRTIGLEKTLLQLNGEIARVNNLARAGLIRGGLLILRESNKIAPRDTSNMAASGFVTWAGKPESQPNFKLKTGTSSSFDTQEQKLKTGHVEALAQAKIDIHKHELIYGPAVEVGYSAYYTLYVHEDLTAKHKAGKEAKFLQRAIDRNMNGLIPAIKSGGKAI